MNSQQLYNPYLLGKSQYDSHKAFFAITTGDLCLSSVITKVRFSMD